MQTLLFHSKWRILLGLFILVTFSARTQPVISAYDAAGHFSADGCFTNGVCTLLRANTPKGFWLPIQNLFTVTTQTNFSVSPSPGYYRMQFRDLTPSQNGFNELIHAYGLLTTIAGAGGTGSAGANKWNPESESGPAVNAFLSRPHIAMADEAGNVYIADKEAHAIREVLVDGTIITVAGYNVPANGPDTPTPGILVGLNNPNGLWVRRDGTVYILDLDNNKVRRLDPDGTVTTVFYVNGLNTGRGLWVNEDETLAYVCSGTILKKWTPEFGVTDLASGFSELGNLGVDPKGRLYVTDRNAHLVYRIGTNGQRTVVAGNGTASGGGDGQPALLTGLEEVRGIFFLPSGAYFLATHRGSQVWYVDTDGIIHLFLNGHTSDTHAGDGTWFYNPNELRVSEIRQITVDYQGDLLVCENDSGFIRKVKFLPFIGD